MSSSVDDQYQVYVEDSQQPCHEENKSFLFFFLFSLQENDFNKALKIVDGMHQLFFVALICKATMVAIVDNRQNGK